ncbi:MAG: lysylphosphatidylglycerol synthase transmembrane domain-containing protein [Acidimicrobiales bacterium]
MNDEGDPDRRRPWVFPARALASCVMLGLLIPRVELSTIVPRWDTRTGLWLAVTLVVTLFGIVLSTLRWRQVLVALGLRTKTRTLFGHYLAGLFVGNFLPSTVGGDVLRVTRLAAANGERPDTFASVVLERLTGWLVLPVITLVGLVVNPELRSFGTPSRLALTIAIGTLVVLSLILVAVASPRVGNRFAGSDGWARFASAVHLGVDRFRHNPAAAAAVLGVGFAYQLVVMLGAFAAARVLGLPVGPTAILAFMPAVAIAQVLPISLGGLGVREGAFVLFLHPLGVATEEAIALGILIYAVNLVVSLLGAPAFAIGSRPQRLPA